MDTGAWWATVHRVAEGQTRLKHLSTHTQGTRSHTLKVTVKILSAETRAQQSLSK